MQSKQNGTLGSELMKHRAAISKLAASEDARELMRLLGREGGVKQAAQAAAGGDAAGLVAMVEELMRTEEGARLTQRISQQAKQAGLE